MVAQDKKKTRPNWLTFSAYTLKLVAGESIQANGLLFDGSHYALELRVFHIDEESVTLRCAGRIGNHDIPPQHIPISLVPGVAVPLELAMFASGSRLPLLFVYWEPSVQISPGQTAVLVIGQQSATDESR